MGVCAFAIGSVEIKSTSFYLEKRWCGECDPVEEAANLVLSVCVSALRACSRAVWL
jgi:hypothetical protein